MKEGDLFTNKGVLCEVLWGPIPGGARHPEGTVRYWAKRCDTGAEGWAVFNEWQQIITDA